MLLSVLFSLGHPSRVPSLIHCLLCIKKEKNWYNVMFFNFLKTRSYLFIMSYQSSCFYIPCLGLWQFVAVCVSLQSHVFNLPLLFLDFNQAGSLQLLPISVEITYGLERILMLLQVNLILDFFLLFISSASIPHASSLPNVT